MNRTEGSLPESSEILQWHPAFYAGLQIELQDEADKLIFDDEYQLSTKPMEIDVLIIKKDTKEKIHKNIGRIFRTYNIIEYKSPTDYLSLDDFYKVMAYAYFYKADTGKVGEIPIGEITLTFVCKNYPQTLISHLQKEWGCHAEQIESGIYYVTGGKLMVPVQILLNHKLSKEENLWLHSLTM